MKARNFFLIIMLIIAFTLAISSVNALKLEHEECNSHNSYFNGLKSVSAQGYEYHNGKLHKNVIKPRFVYEAPYCYNGLDILQRLKSLDSWD